MSAFPREKRYVADLENTATGFDCTRHTIYGRKTFVIAPDGSIYSYKAVSRGNPGAGYYILKWTWVE